MTYEQDNRISGSSRSSKRSKLFASQNFLTGESPDLNSSRNRQYSGIYLILIEDMCQYTFINYQK